MLSPIKVTQAIDLAFERGHWLKGFEQDSDDSVVAECIMCGALVAVDGQDMFGEALTRECRRSQ